MRRSSHKTGEAGKMPTRGCQFGQHAHRLSVQYTSDPPRRHAKHDRGGGVVVWNFNHQIKIERDLDPDIIRDRKIMVKLLEVELEPPHIRLLRVLGDMIRLRTVLWSLECGSDASMVVRLMDKCLSSF